jgi:hypothetical protein
VKAREPALDTEVHGEAQTEVLSMALSSAEGNSLHSICRMTGVTMEHRAEVAGRPVRRLRGASRRTRARRETPSASKYDEIWQYLYAKAKNVPEEKTGTFGCGDAVDVDSHRHRYQADGVLHGPAPGIRNGV